MYVDVTLDDIILYALEHHVSDIHFDPTKSGVQVRLRQDGLLRTNMTVSSEEAELIINRIKVCSALDISEKRLPQDGRWAWSHKDTSVTMRVSTLPSLYGETLVCRLMGNEGSHKDLTALGMRADIFEHIKQLLKRPYGLLLICGPTGSGKTLLAQTLAKMLEVPFAIADATSLTEAGYVGEDVENILLKLIQAADYDIERAERGIIYIDEIDKIARKSDNPSITRDVSGEGVQQGLLKLLEGSIVNVPPQGGRKHPEQKMIAVDTKNILFVCGGAFDGIEKKIAQRLNTRVVGYSASLGTATVDRNNLLKYITPTDLKSFGLIPEIIGRLPILTYLNPLDRDTLRNILTEPKNSIIKQYVKLFEMDGIKLTFDEKVYEFIVDKALEFKLGARGLRSIVEAVMMDAMYSMPSQKVKELHVTLEYAKEKFEKSDVNRLQVA